MANELLIYTDEDGMPWLAFIWGEADPQTVAAMITLEEIERQTGCDEETITGDCSWPPSVKAHWIRREDDSDERWLFCEAGAEAAQRVTGHRFYPQT